MLELTKKYEEIMKEIENEISDEKKFQFVNKKIAEISMLQMEIVNEMVEIVKTKIENMENVQASIEKKVNQIQTSIAGIESDIYEDSFDFEIVCPYCNNEFTADIESKSEIRCPECENVIELDWNAQDGHSGCSGSCSTCSSTCGESFFSDMDEDDEDEDM